MLKNRIVRENISIDKRRGNNTKRINFVASYNYYDENGETIKLRIKSVDKEKVEKLFLDLGFKSLIVRMPISSRTNSQQMLF